MTATTLRAPFATVEAMAVLSTGPPSMKRQVSSLPCCGAVWMRNVMSTRLAKGEQMGARIAPKASPLKAMDVSGERWYAVGGIPKGLKTGGRMKDCAATLVASNSAVRCVRHEPQHFCGRCICLSGLEVPSGRGEYFCRSTGEGRVSDRVGWNHVCAVREG